MCSKPAWVENSPASTLLVEENAGTETDASIVTNPNLNLPCLLANYARIWVRLRVALEESSADSRTKIRRVGKVPLQDQRSLMLRRDRRPSSKPALGSGNFSYRDKMSGLQQ